MKIRKLTAVILTLSCMTGAALFLPKQIFADETTTAAETSLDNTNDADETTKKATKATKATTAAEETTESVNEVEGQIEETDNFEPNEETTLEEESSESIPDETETTSEATSVTVNNVDVYEKGEEKEKVNPKEEEESNPTGAFLLLGIFIGILLGGVGGYFLGTYLLKKKIDHEHDTVYRSIAYGETKESLAKQKEIEDRKKKVAEEKRKREREAEIARIKAEREAQKAQKKREQQMKQLEKLQAELGMTVETPKQEEETKVESAPKAKPVSRIDLLKAELFGKGEDSEPENEADPEDEPEEIEDEYEEAAVVKPAARPAKKPINPDDMEKNHTPDNQGYDFYFDPNDPSGEPFRIKDGKKAFYPDEPNGPFTDEDGNPVYFD